MRRKGAYLLEFMKNERYHSVFFRMKTINETALLKQKKYICKRLLLCQEILLTSVSVPCTLWIVKVFYLTWGVAL